ncbi:uncharacterized protein LOC130622852 [Hydractinia symbiolongicarpus]|uniref:uncharacterized protein LOC130622852 n=1 Tax=Hydractinia symbiolongicarpus TaxID=13093 RepID=UPI0025503A3E|nr:uncharacterized protein LOC130622852 [Hydractinia symbiolongicarpus]
MKNNCFIAKTFTLTLTQESTVSSRSVLLQGSKNANIHEIFSEDFKLALDSYREHAKKIINKQLNLSPNIDSYDIKFSGFSIKPELVHAKTSIVMDMHIVGNVLMKKMDFYKYEDVSSAAVKELIEVLKRAIETVVRNHADIEITSMCYGFEGTTMSLKFLLQKANNGVFSSFEENQIVQVLNEESKLSEFKMCLSDIGIESGTVKIEFPCLKPFRYVFVTTNIVVDESHKLLDLADRLEGFQASLEVFSVFYMDMQKEKENVLNTESETLVHPLRKLETSAEDHTFIFGKKIERCVALILVDIQNDFISGSLALRDAPAREDGEKVVSVINEILEKNKFDLVVYTQDWHPSDHCSFITNVDKYEIHSCSKKTAENVEVFDQVVYDGDPVLVQEIWPPHCIQGSYGAMFHKDLNVVKDSVILQIGTNPSIDSYSAFWDNARKSQSKLKSILESHNITTVVIAGLATDYCVGATSIHAAEFGFDTYIVRNACCGIHPTEIEIRIEQMIKKGVSIIGSHEIPQKHSPWLSFPPISPGGNNQYTEDSVTVKTVLENYINFQILEKSLNKPDNDCNWLKLGNELSKVVNITETYLIRIQNRARCGGGNPAEELFNSMKSKLPTLTIADFTASIKECRREDVLRYLNSKVLPELFTDLSLEEVEDLSGLLNTSNGPGWDILAAILGYSTSEIDLIRSVSIQSGHTYSPTGSLLRRLLHISPDLKVSVLINAARRIQRNDIANFLLENITEMNNQRMSNKRHISKLLML